MSEALAFAPPALPILELLACPWRRAPIVREASGLRCASCQGEFPEREGIVDLARRGTAETWGAGDSAASSQGYQLAYAGLERARDYNRAYEVRTLKRLSTRRERRAGSARRSEEYRPEGYRSRNSLDSLRFSIRSDHSPRSKS